jgi:outer membrane lipoprotein SlyB
MNRLLAPLAAVMMLAGCTTGQDVSVLGNHPQTAMDAHPAPAPRCVGTGQVLGSIGGAAAGAYAGSRFGKGWGNTAATVGGGLLGAAAGNAVGRSFDSPCPTPRQRQWVDTETD